MEHVTLDAFQPWPDLECYVYGTAVITYDLEPPDHDSGWRGGPVNIALESLDLGSTSVPPALFEAVAKALEARGWLI